MRREGCGMITESVVCHGYWKDVKVVAEAETDP